MYTPQDFLQLQKVEKILPHSCINKSLTGITVLFMEKATKSVFFILKFSFLLFKF